MPESCVYAGEVMHRRAGPVRHRFVYRVFSMLLDVDEIPERGRRLRLFSHNRFNLYAFHDRDHGARDGSPLRGWVERHLAARGLDLAGGRMFIHCLPRLLGYAFNPISIIWCYDATGALRAILYEVKNTFGEQHGYLIPVSPGRRRGAAVSQRARKIFYVSPFIGMDAEYHFRVREPEDRLSVVIRETVGGRELLVATHLARRRPLCDASLIRAFLAFPLVTLKILAGIHWEAARLWFKGAPLYDRAPAPAEDVSP